MHISILLRLDDPHNAFSTEESSKSKAKNILFPREFDAGVLNPVLNDLLPRIVRTDLDATK